MVKYKIVQSDELYHHGIRGQKWGVRRYQNADGSLKSAGKKRYSSDKPLSRKEQKKLAKEQALKEKAELNRRRSDAWEMYGEADDLGYEFDQTAKGKKLLKAYKDAVDKLEDPNTEDDDPDFLYTNNPGSFSAIEREYLYEKGKYAATKLIDKYGTEKFADINLTAYTATKPYSYKDVEDLIDKYADSEAYVHSW